MINVVDRDTDLEEEEGGMEKKEIEEIKDYSDYYKMMAQSKAIRPICVSEGVNFNIMSSWNKTCWWSKACLQMLR